eukprot:scaffold8641_cov134-Isochrysis_galbana.AAC.19
MWRGWARGQDARHGAGGHLVRREVRAPASAIVQQSTRGLPAPTWTWTCDMGQSAAIGNQSEIGQCKIIQTLFSRINRLNATTPPPHSTDMLSAPKREHPAQPRCRWRMARAHGELRTVT